MGTSMTINHQINGIAFEVDADSAEYRKMKEAAAQESNRLWAELDDDSRAAYREIAQRSLELLHASVDYWLPNSLVEQTSGDRIQIINEILYTDVHATIALQDEAIAFEEERIRQKLQARASEEADARTDEEFLAYIDTCIDHGTRLSNDEARRLRSLTAQ